MGAEVFPPGSGLTALAPFTGPVLTVPAAINQLAPTTLTAVGQTSTFVTNNPAYGGNSYATATLHLRAGGLGALGFWAVVEGSDDAQANWTPLGGVNAATGRYDTTLIVPDNGTAMWFVPVAGLSIIRVRVILATSGGVYANWTGSAAGIISPSAQVAPVADHAQRSAETTLTAVGQTVTVNCYDTAEAAWWIRGGPWTGLGLQAFVSARGTQFAQALSVPMDGAASSITPTIANAGAANAVVKGFRVNCSTATFMRVQVALIGSGSVIVEADSAVH